MDLENQRLKQKILDLEEQVTISREREMDAMRDLEQEKLRSLHNKSLERVSISCRIFLRKATFKAKKTIEVRL